MPALGVDLLDDLEDLAHEQGGQAERRLVEQQEAGLGHEGAPDHQHLLLAAAQVARAAGARRSTSRGK